MQKNDYIIRFFIKLVFIGVLFVIALLLFFYLQNVIFKNHIKKISNENWINVSVTFYNQKGYKLTKNKVNELKNGFIKAKNHPVNHQKLLKHGKIMIETDNNNYHYRFSIVKSYSNDLIIESLDYKKECLIYKGAKLIE